MGSITAHETAKGKRYRVQYRKPDHAQTDKRGYRTKRDAELFLASTEVKMVIGEFIDATASRINIEALGVPGVRAQSHLKPSSFAVIEVAWRVHVQPKWGSRVLGEIRHSEVQTWGSELSATKSATVVIRAYGVLAGIIDIAVRDRRLPTNPARGVNLPRRAGKPRHYLSHAQVQLLADQSRANSALVLFLAYTGPRWGQAVGLRLRSVDMQRRRVRAEANAVNVRGDDRPRHPEEPRGAQRAVPRVPGRAPGEAMRRQGPRSAGLRSRRRLHPDPHAQGRLVRRRSAALDPDFPQGLTLHDFRTRPRPSRSPPAPT